MGSRAKQTDESKPFGDDIMSETIMKKVSAIEAYVANNDCGFLGTSIQGLIAGIRGAETPEQVAEIWPLLRNNYNAIGGAPRLSNSQPTLPEDKQTAWDSHKAKKLMKAAIAFATVFLPTWNKRGASMDIKHDGRIHKGVPCSFETVEEMANYLVAHADKQMMIRYSAGVWGGDVDSMESYDYSNEVQEEAADSDQNEEVQG
tara:strand:- start:6608 stop:7213 length:606 start_codon:yes stop_codon:yes gene_type:complete